jgi:aspartate kinase
MKVCKFGGSSVKDASQIKKVLDIVKEDDGRRVIVVSAPGRDDNFDEKITDHLLNVATSGKYFEEHFITISKKQSYDAIIEDYVVI